MNRGEQLTPITLARVPLPKAREHASGYIRRLAAENGLLLKDFRQLFGIRRLTPRSTEETWTRVAARIGVPASVLESLRWRSDPNSCRWLSFHGHQVHESYLHQDLTRVCRFCVTQDGIVDSAWSLRHVTACPIHEVRLTADCAGCGEQRSLTKAYTGWDCPHCGFDIRFGGTSPATEDELTIAEWLYGTLDPKFPNHRAKDIPLRADRTSLLEMLTSLEYLGCLTAEIDSDLIPPRLRRHYARIFPDPEINEDRQRSANARALAILRTWPVGYRDLLEGLLDKNPSPPDAAPLVRRFATKAGIYAIRPLSARDGTPFPFISDERFRFLQDRAGYRPRTRIVRNKHLGGRTTSAPRSRADTAGLMSTHAVREMVLGAQHGDLSPFIEAGLLKRVRVNKQITAFEIEGAQALGSVFERLPEPPPGETEMVQARALLRTAILLNRGTAFLHGLVAGKLEAYSSGPRLCDVYLPRHESLHSHSLWKLEAWTGRNHYVDLAKFNVEAKRLWGPLGIYSTIEANQLVAAKRLGFNRANFKTRRGDPRLYHVGDLIRDIQSWLGPFLIDVDSIEPPLPVFD